MRDITLAQARSDFKYICNHYGLPYDFCGGFYCDDQLEKIYSGEITVKDSLIQCIEYYFTDGFECYDKAEVFKDKRIQMIAKRYSQECELTF